MHEVHPTVADLPDVTPAEYSRITRDLRQNGQRWPVVLFEGKILDGRARYRASREIGVPPWLVPLRGHSPIDFYVNANVPRLGEPRSLLRHEAVERLMALADDARCKAALRIRQDWIRSARREFARFERSRPGPCAVCKCSADFAAAHHVFPLSLQWDCGLAEPIHDHAWLCPVHHKLVHVMLSGYLLGSRDLSFLGSTPDEYTGEWLAIEKVAQSGIELCCDVLGRIPGRRCDPPYGLMCAMNHDAYHPWRTSAGPSVAA